MLLTHLHHVKKEKRIKKKLRKPKIISNESLVSKLKQGKTSLPFLTPLFYNMSNVPTLGSTIGNSVFKKPTFPVEVDVSKMPVYLLNHEEEAISISVDDPIFEIKSAASTSGKSIKTEYEEINFAQLRSLKNLGIDVSFLDQLERESKLQARLNVTGKLILQLKEEQNVRLNQGLKDPSKSEKKLAEIVAKDLILMTKFANPGDIVSTEALHKAMGIDL